MEYWQAIVSFCAGIITLLTLVDKVRGTKSFKEIDKALDSLKKIPSDLSSINKDLASLSKLQITQNTALLALLRNDLYRCFKDNRDICAWTDDDAQVQTKLHEAYRELHGNGEEEIWWEKKKTWRIVSESEYNEIVKAFREKKLA